MEKRIKMHYMLFILVIWCAACKKNQPLAETPSNTPIEVPVTPTPSLPDDPVSISPTYSRTYEVGTGSGNLSINGNSLNIDGNILIKIKGGNYASISISNVNGIKGVVTIQNDGLVQLTSGQMRLENLNNVTITGNGTTGIEKGFSFRDNSYRAIEVNGVLNNFTLQYATFKNIGDNVITYKYTVPFTGSEDSYSKNLKFLHIDCDNTRQFLSGSGLVENGTITGHIKNIEIAYLNFVNSPYVGTVVWLGNAENYDIHHNTINNINTENNNHNGIFLINGNGKFHHNRISNHQGNAIRAFAFTLGTTPKEVLIYNNIVYNSRKYSAFEVQGFSYNITPGKSTFVNAHVFNNTCGSLNTSHDWQGNLVDVYGLQGGKCTVTNNLAFDLPAPFVIAGQVSDLVPVASNNLYFKTYQDAGIVDESTFKLNANSAAKMKGIFNSFLTDDFYGNRRNALPSIGAVE